MTWKNIRTLGKVKYFNISYVVLFLIPFLADFYTIIITHNWGITEFPFKLKLLYGASLTYALGIAVYQFFCPEIIRKYDNEHDYVKAYFDIDRDLFLDQKLEIVLSNLVEAQVQINDEIKKLHNQVEEELDATNKVRLKSRLNEKLDLVYEGCIKRHLLKEYNENLKKNKLAIYVSGLFYISGSIALLWLLYEKSLNVFILHKN